MAYLYTPKLKGVMFKASEEELAQMDKRAKELFMNRSEYIRYLARKDIYESDVARARKGSNQ